MIRRMKLKGITSEYVCRSLVTLESIGFCVVLVLLANLSPSYMHLPGQLTCEVQIGWPMAFSAWKQEMGAPKIEQVPELSLMAIVVNALTAIAITSVIVVLTLVFAVEFSSTNNRSPRAAILMSTVVVVSFAGIIPEMFSSAYFTHDARIHIHWLLLGICTIGTALAIANPISRGSPPNIQVGLGTALTVITCLCVVFALVPLLNRLAINMPPLRVIPCWMVACAAGWSTLSLLVTCFFCECRSHAWFLGTCAIACAGLVFIDIANVAPGLQSQHSGTVVFLDSIVFPFGIMSLVSAISGYQYYIRAHINGCIRPVIGGCAVVAVVAAYLFYLYAMSASAIAILVAVQLSNMSVIPNAKS